MLQIWHDYDKDTPTKTFFVIDHDILSRSLVAILDQLLYQNSSTSWDIYLKSYTLVHGNPMLDDILP